MCGHVGIAGKLEYKDEAAIKRLLILDYFRGPDSTGLGALRKDGSFSLTKIASHPIDLFDTKAFTKTLSAHQSLAFLGHNRLATKGLVTGVNAHPYIYGDVIGAHNGTLEHSSWQELDKMNGEESAVDSQALIMAISKFGVEEVLPKIKGAWAIVWIDSAKGELNFIRNKERPLWYSYDEEFKKVFWASEYPMIAASLKMSTQGDYKLAVDEDNHSFYQIKENWWYKWNLKELEAGSKERPKPKVKEVKGKETTAVSYHAPFKHGTGSHGTTPTKTTALTTTSQTSVTSLTSFTDKQNVIDLAGWRTNPHAGQVSKTEFEALAKHGCSWCSGDIEYEDVGVTIFKDQEAILCPTCSENGNASRIYVNGVPLAS